MTTAAKEKTLPKVPEAVREKFTSIANTLQQFCNDHLNDECTDLAIKLAAKIARKKPSPFLSGKINTWAAGIMHALCTVNCLFDMSNTPCVSSKNLANWFNLAQNTISEKSRVVRNLFKMRSFDTRWTLPSQMDSNPMAWMIQVDGLIVDARHVPYPIQKEAYEKGFIPYIPNESGEETEGYITIIPADKR